MVALAAVEVSRPNAEGVPSLDELAVLGVDVRVVDVDVDVVDVAADAAT